jgi:quercetin dioxygenase-like cupin family protein
MKTEYLWFFNTLVQVSISFAEGSDEISVLEHRAPYGDSPPRHIHHTEDEIFRIIEGEFRFQVEGRELQAKAGDYLLAPKGKPHTYRVESAGGGRWLTVTANGDFEKFVRAVGRPAERIALPSPAGPPDAQAMANLAEIAKKYAIELCGPALI